MKIDFGNLRFRFDVSLIRLALVEGINSNIVGTDKHILLWDFDNQKLTDIENSLAFIQYKFGLPTIRIVESSESKYHAYCFVKKSWAKTLYILASTKLLDEIFFKLGVVRGYFTLRITPKRLTDQFKFVSIMQSHVPDELNLPQENLEQFRYITDGLEVSKYKTGVM